MQRAFVQVLMIGFSADLGRSFGDTKEHCGTTKDPRWAAAAVYIVGFWFLDFANNTVQGPARAMMADLSGTYVRQRECHFFAICDVYV
jgi:solute carrier family 45 protein 1/2/4